MEIRNSFYPAVVSFILFTFFSSDAKAFVPIDTIPLKERTGDFIHGGQPNIIDLNPSIITQEIEYDPLTDQYIIIEKIGNEYYRTPTYMTFQEYMEWKSKEQEKAYFQRLGGLERTRNSRFSGIDPMGKIDIQKSISDRLFGGSEVEIKPQGSVDLTLGIFDYQRRDDPSLPQRQQRQIYVPGEFNMKPRLNVAGGIGDKLNLNFNFDAQSTFSFDQQIKLKYDSENFSQDDIIKKVEAGDVSLPLRSNLIQGPQSLFGIKTELQFGKLRVTALASQQRSKQNNLRVENGASIQEFEIRPDEYDENRHFFLSHYNRNTYERALSNLPQINTSFRIAQMEVWISDDRPEYQEGSTMIAALADIGEPDIERYNDPTGTLFPPNPFQPTYLTDITGIPLADNRVNLLFRTLENDPNVNQLDRTASELAGPYRLKQTRDFEVFRGRLLNSSEYTFHPELGFISLNIRLRPNQVLAVSYKYYYTAQADTVYTVGQMATEGLEYSVGANNTPEPAKVIFTKLLKSSNQQSTLPSWDLMMKNVYNLRTSQLNNEDFEFDIFYEDDFDDGSLKKYLPEEGLRYTPLLNIFNLDNLNRFNDPQADGIFDYVPGVTVIERTGSIVFPVLEPFGSSLAEIIGDPALIEKYVYQELYDTTITIARQSLEKNKFVMVGRVKSTSQGEIQLSPFVPRGSVRVTAGGRELVEGVDYEIDYSLGRLRVINPSYLSQGTPINVSYEDNSAFSLQQKQMLGLRVDYDFSKKFTMGATYLRLFERPYTAKVNIGEDPINNRVFGLDMNFSDEAPWLTNIVDKLPFYSTNIPSVINFTAEAAYLKPGHSNAINVKDNKNDGLFTETGGIVNIDDFEGAINGFTLGGFNTNIWVMASTPPEFPEAGLTNDLRTNSNRAKLSWYQIDRSARRGNGDNQDPYTRIVDQRELFKRDIPVGQTELFTFDISYYPRERGPYNFDVPNGYPGYTQGVTYSIENQKLFLNDPASRWGGIMRYFQNTDFEAANYEFMDFWVLNPFMDRRDGEEHVEGEEGEIVFHLGNVSEDIIKDNLQFYENGIPIEDGDPNVPIKETNVGRVALNVPVANGFDRQNGRKQDVGFDGLNDDEEKVKFKDYLDQLKMVYPSIPTIENDPSGDNYVFFNDASLDNEDNLVTRLKDFTGPERNAPLENNLQEQSFVRGNRLPESEDLNNNRSLDQGEAYYEYRLKVKNVNGLIDTAAAGIYYKQTKIIRNPSGVDEAWYRFQIPISSGVANGISGFRAIQFMRMYFTEFSSAKTFRFAEFQLVRNTWRRSDTRCDSTDISPDQVFFAVDEVGIEENSNREPFNYVRPTGVLQERIQGSFGNFLQDEKSMSLTYCDLGNGCQVGVNKLTRLNLTQYEKLQLFVHAESKGEVVPDHKVAILVRLGKDMVNNYYEYEIPLRMSDIQFNNDEDSIWLIDNFVNLSLDKLRDVKKAKISNGIQEIDDPDKPGAKIRIKGVPSLGYIKVIEVSLKNLEPVTAAYQPYCGEVWINDLRAVGLHEEGGYAAQARLQMKLADLGELNFSGSYSSIGYGALDQRLQDRSQEELIEFNAAANIQLGKLLPKQLPINLPMYAQFSRQISNPLYDPYQLDLTVEELLEITPEAEKQDVRERAREQTTLKTINFTNVKVESGNGKMPWSPSNLRGSYAYSETEVTDPIIEADLTVERSMALEYQYTPAKKNIKPLKGIKSEYLKLLSEFNFNPLPASIGFNTNINRYNNSRTYRLPEIPVFQFDDQRFKWDRNYVLDWDLTNALRFNFRANVTSIVDELRQTGIADDPSDRPWVNEYKEDYTDQVQANPDLVQQYRRDNLRNLGRAKNYRHSTSLSYKIPISLLPAMDWITATADYKSEYGWMGGALISIDELGTPLGNIIDNSQSRALNANFSFDKLYTKWGYLKKIDAPPGRQAATTRSRTRPQPGQDQQQNADPAQDRKEKQNDGKPSTLEKVLIRPLMLLRSVKLSYKEDFGTMVPGFMPESEMLGLSSGFAAPGFDFVAGMQPNLDSWLHGNEEWFNPSPNFNSQISQRQNQSISGKISIIPFRDFVVDVDLTKNYRQDHTEVFRTRDDAFLQLAQYDIGSFEYTHLGISTLFEDSRDLYTRYKTYRVQVSNSLENRPNAGSHPDYPEYAAGYGPTSYAVNVPAFLAAYTGKAPSDISNNIQSDVRSLAFIPKPNWALRYDGLSKLPMFKNILTSFMLKHSYRSTVNVAKFNTAPDFFEDDPFSKVASNNNYYSRLEIPAISISEQFNPLIGINLKTKNNIQVNLEYKKSRQMDLRLNANELSETKAEEMVMGLGYTFQRTPGNTKKGKARTRTGTDGRGADDNKSKLPQVGLGEKQRAITVNVDFSIRDDESGIYRLENEGDSQPRRGQRSITLKPLVEYQMYKNLIIRFFVDYQSTEPKVTNQFPITRLQAGTTVRFTFN